MSNVSKLKKKAADFEQKKQFDRAVQAYIELLDTLAHDIDDADIPLYNRVGDILIRQNSAAEALVYYEKAVDLYSERGFLNNAIALCNKILRQSPGRTVIYYKLGKISATKGFKSDAKRNFLEYADRMEKSGKRDEAFRALKEFADLCPDQDDVRLMLAEHLARDNRRDEAIEQLQTLHAKLETEGRSAEARATLDRMKAIDPNVEPRPSGAYQTIKSNELVFLDIDEVPKRRTTPRNTTPIPPIPAAKAPQPEDQAKPAPAIESSNGALEGLTLTFVPDEASPADATGELLDGFTATGEQARITPGSVAPIDDFETGRAEPAPIDVEFPSLVDIPAVTQIDAAYLEATRIEVEGFADETMSESEFAELELEPLDMPLDERPHDLALPSALPLIRFTDEVPVVDANEPAKPAAPSEEGIDIDAEIMSPIARSAAPAAIDDQAFDLTEEVTGDSLDAAAAELDSAEAAVELPNASAMLDVEATMYPELEATPVLDFAAAQPTESETEDEPQEPAEDAPKSGAMNSLEWEDLAAAAAAHDVEPLEVPPPAETAPPVSNNEPSVDADFLDVPPTFGSQETPPQLSVSPLSPETLEAIPEVHGDERTVEQPIAASATPAEPPPVRVQRRTPPQALESHKLLDALRDQVLASPNEHRLRRRLAEALLETGDREHGLRELDAVMHGMEREGDLATARDIASEILRLVPASVRHHQKCVEYAVRAGDRVRLIEAYVALADVLFRSGEHDKACAVYGRVVELEPNETRAVAALEILAGRLPAGPSESEPLLPVAVEDLAPDDDAPLFAELGLEDLDAEVAAAFQTPDDNSDGYDEADHIRDGVFQTPAFVSGADFVDLGAMLRGDQPSKSTRMVVGDAKPTGDEQADFEDMLRRFKQGVAANVDDEDFDSHYDLGVAFKEMGLVDDAIAQFQKALRSDNHRSRAYEALGQCFVEKGQHQVAATLLARAVETTRVDDRVLVGSLYLLAYALEQLQREREALVYYHRVFAVDVEFRDVADRIRSLESHAAT
ncbi:MAG: tetratricopeptide repeat protein [Gemmatimonadaceae bacterium]